MRKMNKKAFTLVELLVVIAILACLATVGVVGFNSFKAKSNLSADETNISLMNRTLAADKVDNDYKYPSDAIQGLYRNGWNSGKLETFSRNYSYAYSKELKKMFLLDNNDNVVYPNTDVDKATLYGFYKDAVETKIEGITKYIAMANIDNASNLEQAFGTTDNYEIDLNGYYFGVEGTHTNLTVYNGGLVKGNVTIPTDEAATVKEYEVVTLASNNPTTANNTYENKVFEGIDGSKSYINLTNVTFKNCVFYNSSVRTNNCSGNVVFDNCSFIGGIGGLAGIELYHDKNDLTSVTVKNCTFNQTGRGINIACKNTNAKTINIENNTFLGVSDPKYLIQVASNRYIDTINIKNNKFESLGSAVTIVRFHDGYEGFGDTTTLNNFTFSGNTVGSAITSDKYVDLDGTNHTEFYNAALAKFTNGLA